MTLTDAEARSGQRALVHLLSTLLQPPLPPARSWRLESEDEGLVLRGHVDDQAALRAWADYFDTAPDGGTVRLSAQGDLRVELTGPHPAEDGGAR